MSEIGHWEGKPATPQNIRGLLMDIFDVGTRRRGSSVTPVSRDVHSRTSSALRMQTHLVPDNPKGAPR